MTAARDIETSEDAFLDGLLMLRQPRTGYRAGLDAVMLAASIPAQAGDTVIEAGCGVGAAALCLARRAEGVSVTGIDIDADALALAADNAARNGLALALHQADLSRPGEAMRKAGIGQASFDHAFANPPFHAETHVRAPQDDGRARAHLRDAGLLEAWMRFLSGAVKSGGTITMILPAGALGEVLALYDGRAGGATVFPLFPRAGDAAHRIIVQGRKGSRAPVRIMPGMVLHGAGDGFTGEADAILRHGAALPLS